MLGGANIYKDNKATLHDASNPDQKDRFTVDGWLFLGHYRRCLPSP
jgi:hypothetical protein